MKKTLAAMFALASAMILTAAAVTAQNRTSNPAQGGATFTPRSIPITAAPPVSFTHLARQAVLAPERAETEQIEPPAPGARPDFHKGVNIPPMRFSTVQQPQPAAPVFGTPSPVWSKDFKASIEGGTTIPPDTMGAVGVSHVMTVTNDKILIQDRNGVVISGPVSLSSFWSGVTIKGAGVSAFDPKIHYDRFNNRWIFESSANGPSVNSGAMFAVSATSDPTGTWYRWAVVADPSSTGVPNGSGNWIDYPTVGFNKNWIVINENVFTYSCDTTSCGSNGYWGQQIYVLDKQAAYSNTLSTINLFSGSFSSTCTTSATPQTELACGFTMAPAITEDNTTETEYLVEDWDSTAGQLRLSMITGTSSTPVLVVGTQFPQSTNSWRSDAARIATSGGYLPQKQQSAYLPSGSRIMANDSRIQNSVLRNGSLWATHTVMLSTTPQPAGTTIGGSGNPIDNHSGIQWWEINPLLVDAGTGTPPIQRGRIEDSTANNCHDGLGGTLAVAPCNGTTAAQFGTFFAFPTISVNTNNDVFIGFSQFSPLTYPNGAYAFRASTDPVNTMRDATVFRPGQSNYNIGAGSGSSRQDRWGDYSAAHTDPLNDTDFWTVQEYAGTNRNDFLNPSYAGPWETWWASVSPSGAIPSTSGSLLISEFRLRGPQGPRDEFVELYNLSDLPLVVRTTDNSDGWTLAYSTDGTTVTNGVAVVPNGTVIRGHGHFLMVDNPDNTAGGTSALTYSLNTYASTQIRRADSDVGWSFDVPDNAGLAIFNTATITNFAAASRMDSAGFSTLAAGLFKKGNGIPALATTTPTGQATIFRDLSSGTPKDTQANEADFRVADPVLESLGVTPLLGAAGPEDMDSPVRNNTNVLTVAGLDPNFGLNQSPNLVYNPTSDPANHSSKGTITIRRRFKNETGQPITRLRFRMADITTANSPAAGATQADLRARTSIGPQTITVSDGSTQTVQATTVEDPPTQPNGGGYDSSVSAGTVTLATPLANGSEIAFSFLFGVQSLGSYSVTLMAEGVPDVAALFSVSGSVPANPTVTTQVSSSAVTLGASVFDTATLANGTNPTGTLTFALYGPNNATCSGTPIFTSVQSVNGNGDYTSASFTPTAAGTYIWLVTYSGDSGNNPATTACGDPNETVTVANPPTPTPTPTATPKVTPAITTNATGSTTIGGTMSDTANLSGGSSPTGNITFRLYGPDDATCGGSVIFTSTVAVNSNGNYPSASYTPTSPGAYRWIATYSGDTNNNSVATACNDSGELSDVSPTPTPTPKGVPTITTQATTSTMVGGTMSDTATLAGGNAPTGIITFRLYGADDASCGGPVIFTSTVAVNGDGTYPSASFQPTSPGTYRWIATYSGDSANDSVATGCNDSGETSGVSPTPTPTATPTATPTPSSVAQNISTRAEVGTGEEQTIGGFIVSGGTKRVLVRGLGPSLNQQGVAGVLADPLLDLHAADGSVIATNDNWRDTQESEIKATGIPPSFDVESAIVATLPAGNYTAVVRGKDNSTGMGLVEIYDLDTGTASKLANLSTRGQVLTGDAVMIGGFILGKNSGNESVIVRGVGPSLAQRGVANPLSDPTLELRDKDGTLLKSNDNWQDDPSQAALVSGAGIAPTDPKESAIAATLPPGNYTAVLAGRNGVTGIGLVELYFQ